VSALHVPAVSGRGRLSDADIGTTSVKFELEPQGRDSSARPVAYEKVRRLERIEKGEIDPSFVITHRASLQEGADLYRTFCDKKEGCIEVVLKP
jgi:threonine dehydrogenase-like Zn-dependent dehydrogenase